MKKFLILFLLLVTNAAFCTEDKALLEEQKIQTRINNIGKEILNANKINKPIVFVYNNENYKKTINDPSITKRQIIFYKDYFKYIENDDEMAAFLAHEISRAQKSYEEPWGGLVSSAQIKAAPKKYEIFSDKRAVDYMVKAGYNPIGLITYINKTCYQGLSGKLFHNTPTKRMSTVYEYIYFNYPYFIKNNSYLTNKNYQNFLLVTSENRKLLDYKIKNRSRKVIKYE